MTVSVHPEASAEFLEAITFYEERQAGLGLDLAAEVKTAIERVVASPEGWPVIEGPIRRCLVHRFPYGILYFIEPAHSDSGRDAPTPKPRLLEASATRVNGIG